MTFTLIIAFFLGIQGIQAIQGCKGNEKNISHALLFHGRDFLSNERQGIIPYNSSQSRLKFKF